MSAACPQLGFSVELDMVHSASDATVTRLRRSFEELIEARGLVRKTERGGRTWTFVVRSEASQATDADRTAVMAWADARGEIIAARVGPIVDLGAP